MNTSPTTTTTTCSLAIETGTEIVSSTGSELCSIALDAAEEANNDDDDDDDASALNASLKAKTMKEVLLRLCGRGLAVSIVIALAGKGFVGHAHNDPPGTDDVMMNVDLGIDNSKQVALLDDNRDGKNVANYDFTKVDGGVSTVRTLQGPNPTNKPTTSYTFTKVGDGNCRDSINNIHDYIYFKNGTRGIAIADVDACEAKCVECPGQGQALGRELRGFNYKDDGVCICFLEKGAFFSSTVCSGALFTIQGGSGTGAICNLVESDSEECWKVVDLNLQCPPTPAPTNKPTTASPTSSRNNSKSAKVAKKVKSSKVTEVNELGAAAANMQVQQMKSGGSSFSISHSHPLVGILALIAFSNLLPCPWV